MSNLDQFIGGGGVKLGGIAYFPHGGPTLTFGGETYLKSGMLATNDGSYGRLLAASAGFGVIVATSGSYAAFGNYYEIGVHWLAIAAKYIAFQYNTPSHPYAYYATSIPGSFGLATFPAALRIHDSGVIGANVFAVSDSGIDYSADGITYTHVGSTYIHNACAVNAAGTLAVACSQSDAILGRIRTSTNGASWTDRTPSGGAGGPIFYAGWSPCCSAFVYAGGGKIHTTPDGYTLTQRALPAGFSLSSGVATVGNGGRYIASSPTSTLISGRYGVLARTTDGATWTAINLSGYTRNGTSQLRLLYVGGVYYAYDLCNSTPGTPLIVSTDDGVTWQRGSQLLDIEGGEIYTMGVANGNIWMTGYSPKPCIPANLTTPTHVGTTQVLGEYAGTGYGSVDGYMRVK